MPLAKIHIANEALRLIGSEELTSLQDSSAESARINNAWDMIVEYLLSLHPWSFALRRVVLARGTDPAFGYAYAFALPADCVRMVSVNDARGCAIAPWVVEGKTLLAHVEHVYALYTAREMDVSTWTAGFSSTAAAYLAFSIYNSITKNAPPPHFEQLFRQRLDMARLDDGAHQQPVYLTPAEQSPILQARLGEALPPVTQGSLDRALIAYTGGEGV